MSDGDYYTKLPNNARLKFSRKAAEAAARLIDDQNHYPDLKFAGNMESFKKFRSDVELVADEYAQLFLAGTKHIRDATMN